MFDTTSTKFPRNKDLSKGIPFLLRVNFKELLSEEQRAQSEKIVCQRCGAFLTDTTDIREHENLGLVYNCVFCGTTNQLKSIPAHLSDSFEVPIDQSLERDTPHDENRKTTDIQPTGRPWIACIDTSGSMKGEPIAAVKRALCNTIDSLESSQVVPHFGLVEFNHHVFLRNLYDSSCSAIPDGLYYNVEELKHATLDIASNNFLADLRVNAGECKSFISSLVADGGTALGPAMVSSLALSEVNNAERVILLTDGQANIGIGSLEGPTSGGVAVYRYLAEAFKRNGTSVDIVGIVSGQHLQLRTLGMMSRLTRGNVYYANLTEIDESVGKLTESESIASNLRMRIITSRGTNVGEVTGVDASDAYDLIDAGQANLSKVSAQDEMYVAIEGDTAESDEISVQVQISYVDNDGRRRNRIFSKNIPTTDDKLEFVDSMDPTIPATYAVQKSAIGQINDETGEIKADTEILTDMAHKLRSVGTDSTYASRFNVAASKLHSMISIIHENIRRWHDRNVCHFMAPIYQYAEADYKFVEAMSRARMTRNQLFQDSPRA